MWYLRNALKTKTYLFEIYVSIYDNLIWWLVAQYGFLYVKRLKKYNQGTLNFQASDFKNSDKYHSVTSMKTAN